MLLSQQQCYKHTETTAEATRGRHSGFKRGLPHRKRTPQNAAKSDSEAYCDRAGKEQF